MPSSYEAEVRRFVLCFHFTVYIFVRVFSFLSSFGTRHACILLQRGQGISIGVFAWHSISFGVLREGI